MLEGLTGFSNADQRPSRRSSTVSILRLLIISVAVKSILSSIRNLQFWSFLTRPEL